MYLSEDLIASVKRRCNVPTSQVTFQNADFLALADEEIRAKMLPLILKHMEEFYVTNDDQVIVANQPNYPIHYRAISMALRDVCWVSTIDPDVTIPIERLNPEDMYSGISGNVRVRVKKTGFFLQGNSVMIYPMPTAAMPQCLLRLKYYMRPSSLILTTSAAIITLVDLPNKQLTVTSVPSTITTATTVDFVRAVPGFECTAIDQTITNITNGLITFSAALPANVRVGDYVCLSGQSNVVQVPVELQPLLFQYIVVRILAAQGDQTNLKAAVAELESLEKAVGLLLAPRVSGKTKRVTNSRGINRWV